MIRTQKVTKKNNKAATIIKLLGQELPQEVFDLMSKEDIEKLILKLNDNASPTKKEERDTLTSFTGILNSKKRNIQSERSSETYDLSDMFVQELEALLREEKPVSLLKALSQKNKTEINLIIQDESYDLTALVLCFANPDVASDVLGDLPEQMKEEILSAILPLDLHSEQERDRLERFLSFKLDVIKSKESISKVKNKTGKKAAELLTRLNPNDSKNLFQRLQEKHPEYAENINEHFYTIDDLATMGRTTLSRFLGEFHPIVLATALKGMNFSMRDQILSCLDPWFSKSVQLEADSMGPVSIAEIEVAQGGILDGLKTEVESGSIKLWRLK